MKVILESKREIRVSDFGRGTEGINLDKEAKKRLQQTTQSMQGSGAHIYIHRLSWLAFQL